MVIMNAQKIKNNKFNIEKINPINKWKKDSKLGFIPSMITVLAMTLGVNALRFLFFGQTEKAIICVIISGLLDALDGRIARYLDVSSKFGSTLDTLADFLNFGIVPAMCMYIKYYKYVEIHLFWVAVIIYINCMALRLARFSVFGMDDGKFFKGVPAPGAAFLLAFPLCCQQANMGLSNMTLGYISVACLLICAILMISNFRTFSLSRATVARKNFPVLFIILAIALNLLYVYTWYFIILIQIFYIGTMFMKKKVETS